MSRIAKLLEQVAVGGTISSLGATPNPISGRMPYSPPDEDEKHFPKYSKAWRIRRLIKGMNVDKR